MTATAPPPPLHDPEPPGRVGVARVVRTPVLAALVLLAVYLGLSLLSDPHGYLGTDTGAKVATLDHMVQTGSWHPSLPYWAESYDPAGRVHPIFQVSNVDGRWVHVTTLPMLLAARPLYGLGGYRLALLLPMAGAIGIAFAARSLARRMAGDDLGWWAFWIVGLASPIVVYALDLWEHTLGVAAIVGAVALLAAVLDERGGSARMLAAGALLGAAATMRTEAFVYAVVAVGACQVGLLVAGRARVALRTGVLTVVGFAGPWLGERLVEHAAGGTSRGARVGSAASGGLSELGDRAHEAVTTLFAARPGALGAVLAGGLLLAGLVVGAVRAGRAGRHDVARACLVALAAWHVLMIVHGLGFVPGMLVAAPLAVVGLASRPPSGTGTYLLAVAVGALPLVWAFQYLGGADPQWAGRYALSSCVILVVLGVVALPQLDRSTRVAIVLISLLVTSAGVGWLVQRSHDVDRWFVQAAARPEEVLISRNGFFVREGGAASAERRWLTAPSDADLRVAVAVVREAGLHTFATVDESPGAPVALDGAHLVGTDRNDFLGTPLYLHSYALS